MKLTPEDTDTTDQNFVKIEIKRNAREILEGAMYLNCREQDTSLLLKARIAKDDNFESVADYVKNKGMVRLYIRASNF